MVEGMARSGGPEGRRDRAEAARLIGAIQEGTFLDLLPPLIADESIDVARQAIRAAQRLVREDFAPDLILALGRPELAEEAADALARLGDTVVHDDRPTR